HGRHRVDGTLEAVEGADLLAVAYRDALVVDVSAGIACGRDRACCRVAHGHLSFGQGIQNRPLAAHAEGGRGGWPERCMVSARERCAQARTANPARSSSTHSAAKRTVRRSAASAVASTSAMS